MMSETTFPCPPELPVAEAPGTSYCRITTGGQWHYSQLEKCDPSWNVELLQQCIMDKDWDMVQELTAGWCQSFKAAVNKLLTPAEREAIRDMKLGGKRQKARGTRQINLPILEVGKQYHSAMNGWCVTVTSIQNDLEICGCTSDGKKLTCDFGDLRALPDSQLLSVDIADQVEILTGKYKGKKATISSQLCEHGPLYLKIEGVGAVVSAKHKFWGHQLSRV